MEKKFIGLTEAQGKQLAKKSGLDFRIMQLDEQKFFGSADFRLNRVNVHIKKGIITFAKLG